MSDDPDLEGAYALQTPDDNRRFYARWAEDYDERFVARTTYQFPALVTAEYLDEGGTWPCLDVGCGTGALAERLPKGAVVDGLDLSPEMLCVARRKGLYRALIEADLKASLPLADGAYAGLVSGGTFTRGHVGPEALGELVRLLRPGALGVISVKPEIWKTLNFSLVFSELAETGRISGPRVREVVVYADPLKAPEGHGDDQGFIVTFRRPSNKARS